MSSATTSSRINSRSTFRTCAPTPRSLPQRHKLEALPFVIDPNGKLAAQVNADRDLGKAIKLDHTPTVYIVSSRNPSKPYVEVKDNNQLYSTIDAMMKE